MENSYIDTTDLNKIKIETKVNIEKCSFFGDIYQESRIV